MLFIKGNILILPMQEYSIRRHDYIGLLMADLVNIIEVDAPENPSHYYACFWRTGSYASVFTIARRPLTVMERNYVPNLL